LEEVIHCKLKKRAFFRELSLEKRARLQPIRNLSFLPIQIKISLEDKESLYYKLAPKIKKLFLLGVSKEEIARKLGISRTTIRKALKEGFPI